MAKNNYKDYKFSRVIIRGNAYYRIRVKYPDIKKKNKRGEWLPVTKNFYGESKAECIRKKEQYEREHEKELLTITEDSALAAAVDFYIREILLSDSSLKQSTKGRYVSAWNTVMNNEEGKALQQIAGRTLKDINGTTLQTVYNNLKCAPSTVRSLNKLVRRLYKYLEHVDITKDITKHVSLPKVEQKQEAGTVEIWEPEELSAILEKSKGHRLHFLFVMAANTGLRIGELLGLKYDDIDREEQVLHVRRTVYRDPVFDDSGKIVRRVPAVRDLKTSSSIRSVPLNGTVMSELILHEKRHKEEQLQKGYRTDFIFTSSTGTIMDHSNLDKAYKRFCRKNGIVPRGFHVFRHTFASRLAQAHVPIETTSALLGHDSITTTAKYYINIASDEKRKAVEVLTLQDG